MKNLFFYPHHSGVVCSNSNSTIPVVSFAPKMTGSLANLKSNLHVCTPNPGNLIHSESPSRIFNCDFNNSSKGNLSALIKKFENINEAASFIDSQYDALILSFANDIRVGWQSPDHLLFAELFYQLNVKIFIFGLGMQDEISGGLEALTENMQEFLKSVKENAVFVGVRGESTGKWLKQQGIDNCVVLGCPSIFRSPSNILSAIKKSRKRALNNVVTAGYIHSKVRHKPLQKLLTREDINCSYIFQNDLFSVFNNEIYNEDLNFYNFDTQTVNHDYVSKRLQKIHGNEQPFERYCYFTNTYSWFMFNSMSDLFIGDRLHAAISALLSGVPSILIYSDLRVKEIADFYSIPSISLDMLESYSLEEILMDKFSEEALEKFEKTYKNRLFDFYEICSRHGLEFIMDQEIKSLAN